MHTFLFARGYLGTMASGWQGTPYFKKYGRGGCFKAGDFVEEVGRATVERLMFVLCVSASQELSTNCRKRKSSTIYCGVSASQELSTNCRKKNVQQYTEMSWLIKKLKYYTSFVAADHVSARLPVQRKRVWCYYKQKMLNQIA